MKHIFRMKIGHSQRYIFQETNKEFFRKCVFVCMQIIEKAASRQKFSDEEILVIVDTHSHIENYARMVQFADNLNFLYKVSNVFVSDSSFFQISFHCHFLAIKLSKENLAISSLSNWFLYFKLFPLNKEGKFYSSFL